MTARGRSASLPPTGRHAAPSLGAPARLRPRSLVRALTAAVLALAVLFASALSGRSHAWCFLAAEGVAEACAGPALDVASTLDARAEQQVALHEHRCGDRETTGLPRALKRSQSRPLAAFPLALLPAATPALPAPTFEPHRAPSLAHLLRAPERAGPCSASARCVALQVYRC